MGSILGKGIVLLISLQDQATALGMSLLTMVTTVVFTAMYMVVEVFVIVLGKECADQVLHDIHI